MSKVAKGLAWSLSQNALSRLLSFAVFAVLGRLLGAEAFGLVALGQAILDVVVMWVDQGAVSYLVHKEELTEDHKSTAFWTSVAISCVLAGAMVAAAPGLAWAFDAPALTGVVRWMALVLPLAALSQVQTALLTRAFEFRALAIRQSIASIVGGAVGIGTALAGWSYYALVAQLLAAQLVSTVALWVAGSWVPRFRWSKPTAVEQLRYGAGITGANLIRIIGSRVDAFIIAAILGTTELGLYAVARRIVMLCSNILHKSADAVILSSFSRQQGDRSALERAYHRALEFSTAVSVPAFVGLALVASDAVALILGAERWQAAVPVLQVMCVAGILLGPSYVNSSAFRATGHPSRLLYIQLAQIGAYFIALAGLYRFGLVGVAGAYVAALAVQHPVELWMMRATNGFAVGPWIRAVARIAGATAVMATAVMCTNYALHELPTAWVRLLAASMAGAVTFIGALGLLAPTLVREARQQLGAVRSRAN